MSTTGSMALMWRRLALMVSAATTMATISSNSMAMAAVVVSPVASKYHVNVDVFFRAFCPACQWFVGDPLLELIRHDEFRNIVNLNVYPAAGMMEKNGVFDCEGGDLECVGHQWEVCIIDKDRHDVVKYLGGLACLEGDESGEIGEWDTKLQTCFTVEERVVLKECYDHRSVDLLRAMMQHKGFDDIGWMPYTLAGGKVLGSASKGVGLHELQVNVCESYKGPKKYYPDMCQSLVGDQKEFAPEEQAPATAAAAAAEATAAPVAVVAGGDATPKPAEPAEKQDAAKQDGEEVFELDLPMKGDDAAADKIRLEIYWRAFCPGCMAFISKPLLKLLSDPEFRAIIDFKPVPAAGTRVDESGHFACTKGVVECQGHRWLSCAIDEFPKVEELIQHLACLESKDNKGSKWSTVIGKCFTSGEDHKRMKTCYDTRSHDLLTKHIAKRSKVEVQWVPYVLLDTIVIGDARHGIGYKQLQDEVCRAFKGREALRPTACQPKRLRQEDGDANEPAAKAEATDKVIKPCPPKKEKAAGGGGAATIAKDAPGAGFRRPDQAKQQREDEAQEVMRELAHANKEEAAKADAAANHGFSMGSLLFPLGCFAIIGIVARRLSGDHKKDA